MPEQAAVAERVASPEGVKASNSLMLHIAHGKFDRSQTATLDKNPKDISQHSYDALNANHQDVRKRQQQEQDQENRKYLIEKEGWQGNEGKITPELLRDMHMANWATTEAKRLQIFLEFAKSKNDVVFQAQVSALAKLHIPVNITQGGISIMPDTFYQTSPNTMGIPGKFYNDFCRDNTNQKLLEALDEQDIVAIKEFLIDTLGSEVAYNSLLATKQTQDALKANHDFASQSTNLGQGEENILGFFQKGEALLKGQPTQTTTQQTVSPTPEAPISEEDEKIKQLKQEIFDKAGKRTEQEATAMIAAVKEQLEKERKAGDGKIQATIAETAASSSGKEVLHDGHVVYIPQKDGDMYVFGDIHGDFTTLKQGLESQHVIERLENGDNVHVVFLGDLVDRGYKQEEVMETLLALKMRYGERITMLKADHEVAEGEGVSEHNFPEALAMKFATPEKITEATKRYENKLRADLRDPNSEFVNRLAYRKVPQDQWEATINKIMDITKRSLTRQLVQSDRQFMGEFGEAYYGSQQVYSYISESLPIYKEYQSLYNVMPRFVVTGNGIALSHGGPPGEIYSIKDLVQISKDKKGSEYVFDTQMTWADPVRGDTAQHEATKQKVISEIKQVFTTNQGDIVEYNGNRYRRDTLEVLLNRLIDFPDGIYPNPRRVGGDYINAVYGGFILYAENALSKEMQKIDAHVWVRGHEEVRDGNNIFWNGEIATIHTTGAGSPDSAYDQPRAIGKFDLGNTMTTIQQNNIIKL